MIRRISLVLLACVVICATAWAVIRFAAVKPNRQLEPAVALPVVAKTLDPDAWDKAVERVKEDRISMAGGALEIPPELKHYTDRHWFLATQVAEVAKYNVQSCLDF